MLVTQKVTAERLREMRGHLPMPIFLWDGDDPRPDPNGFETRALRIVSTVSIHGGDDYGGREMMTASFHDGRPGRVLEPDDEVDIYMLRPGPDLRPGEPLE
jgi:hypothetical protein